MLEYPKVKV